MDNLKNDSPQRADNQRIRPFWDKNLYDIIKLAARICKGLVEGRGREITSSIWTQDQIRLWLPSLLLNPLACVFLEIPSSPILKGICLQWAVPPLEEKEGKDNFVLMKENGGTVLHWVSQVKPEGSRGSQQLQQWAAWRHRPFFSKALITSLLSLMLPLCFQV